MIIIKHMRGVTYHGIVLMYVCADVIHIVFLIMRFSVVVICSFSVTDRHVIQTHIGWAVLSLVGEGSVFGHLRVMESSWPWSVRCLCHDDVCWLRLMVISVDIYIEFCFYYLCMILDTFLYRISVYFVVLFMILGFPTDIAVNWNPDALFSVLLPINDLHPIPVWSCIEGWHFIVMICLSTMWFDEGHPSTPLFMFRYYARLPLFPWFLPFCA